MTISRTAVSPNRDPGALSRVGTARALIPIVLLPILFGLELKIFEDTNRELAAFVVGVVLIVGSVLLSTILSYRWSSRLVAGAAVITCVSLPFWCYKNPVVAKPTPAEKSFASRAVPSRYLYREAKGNPAAYERWYNSYIDELIRTHWILHGPDPKGILGYVLKPGASANYFDGHISINGLGYRGTDFPREKGDAFRILVIGDSVTFGQTLFSDGKPWPAVLDDLLNERLQCKRPLQVINGGVNGYTIKDGTKLVKRDADWLEPDVVMSMFGITDITLAVAFLDWLQPITLPPGVLPEPRHLYVAWMAKTAAVKFINIFRKEASETHKYISSWLPYREDDDKIYTTPQHKEYEALIETTKAMNAKLFILGISTAVVPQSPEVARNFYESAQIIELIPRFNQMLRRLGERHSPHAKFVETGQNLVGRYDDGLFLDLMHLTPEGEAQMATNVYDALMPALQNDARLSCTIRP